MGNRRLLFVLMLLLIAGGIIIPVFLTRAPLPVRIMAGAINLLAALGIGTILRQRKK